MKNNFLMLFAFSFMAVTCSFANVANASSKQTSSFHVNTTVPHYFNGVSSYESDDTIIVLLHGSKLFSTEQLQQNLAAALHLSAKADGSLSSLREILFDRSQLHKKFDITFIEAVSLKENIGAEYVQTLLNLLNEAESRNPDLVTVMYWN